MMQQESSSGVAEEAPPEEVVVSSDEETDPGKDEEEMKKEAMTFFRTIINRLTEAGLDYKSYYSIQQDEVYIKIRASPKRLAEQADAVNFSMKLDDVKLEEQMKAGFPAFGIAPIDIGTQVKGTPVSKYRPCEHIYAKYDTTPELAALYQGSSGPFGTFRSMQRIKLITNILQTNRRFGGCEIPLTKRILQKKILAFLPLHDPVERTTLEHDWFATPYFLPLSYPYDDYKDYFGEQAAFYLKFVGFNASMEIILGIPGTIIYIVLLIVNEGPAQGILRAVYAIFLVCWCALFSGLWFHMQDVTALKWGTHGFEAQESTRPQHKGPIVKSPVHGKEEIYFPPRMRRPAVTRGVLISAAVVAADLAFIFGVGRYRDNGGNATVASIIQAIGIQVFSRFYKGVAVRLTNVENWRTETEYGDVLGSKLFAFNFINSYFALIVLTFSDSKKICNTPNACMNTLELNLLVIFITSLANDIVDAVILPFVMRLYNQYNEGGFDDALSSPEWQYLLSEYDETLDSINSYMALTIQFGYVALFSVAAPIVGLIAALLNAMLVRLEARKYLVLFRRIEPRGGEDIGKFEAIIAGLGVAAPITNAAIVVRLNPPFSSIDSLARRRYIFVISAVIAICFQLVMRLVTVSSRDLDVQLQLDRQAFLRDKIVDRIADEEERIVITPEEPNTDIAKKDDAGLYATALATVLRPVKTSPTTGSDAV